MSTVGANQIRFRCGIAAVNHGNNIRVYNQDTNGGIREIMFQNGHWSQGTEKNVIAQAVLGSPIAATSLGLEKIRVYYVGDGDYLREACYDSGRGWYDGDLSRKNIRVAPYSMIAACFLAIDQPHIRVYAQKRDNTIQEYGFDGKDHPWKEMTNLGHALPGTGLACTSFNSSKLAIRVYLQDEHTNLVERCYDDGKAWYNGAFSVQRAYPRTDLSATSFGKSSIRVFFVDRNNELKEMAYDSNNWYSGGFRHACVPGSQVSAIDWEHGSDVNLRVYFQSGKDVTAVTEWVYSGSWEEGNPALPPAEQ